MVMGLRVPTRGPSSKGFTERDKRNAGTTSFCFFGHWRLQYIWYPEALLFGLNPNLCIHTQLYISQYVHFGPADVSHSIAASLKAGYLRDPGDT